MALSKKKTSLKLLQILGDIHVRKQACFLVNCNASLRVTVSELCASAASIHLHSMIDSHDRMLFAILLRLPSGKLRFPLSVWSCNEVSLLHTTRAKMPFAITVLKRIYHSSIRTSAKKSAWVLKVRHVLKAIDSSSIQWTIIIARKAVGCLERVVFKERHIVY